MGGGRGATGTCWGAAGVTRTEQRPGLDDNLIGAGLQIGGIAAAVAAGATFAALAAGVAALDVPHLKAVQEAGGPDAAMAARLLADRASIEARLLAGRVLCLSIAAVLTTEILIRTEIRAGVFAAFMIALVYGVAAEISTTLMRRRAASLALPTLRYTRPLQWLALPFAAPLSWLAASVDRLFPSVRVGTAPRAVELGVQQAIEQGERSGSITEDHAEMIRSVLEFKDTLAREVMVPRTRMVAIDAKMPIERILQLVLEEGHSRYPVYRERVDQIEGVLCAKDLFRAIENKKPADVDFAAIVRKPVFYAADTQKVSSLLREMQQKRAHLAVVVDEFGGTSGIVTLEDIVEEIVGDIKDEHDVDDARFREIGPGRYLADAGVSVSEVEALLGTSLPEDRESDSIGGMIMELAGKVPLAGESVSVGDLELIVRESGPRRITRVEIRRRPVDEASAN